MEFNLLKIGFSLMTLFVVIMGGLINNIETYLPVFLTQTFRHGKFAYRGTPSPIKIIEVPKSWFRHFYVFSSIYSTCSLVLALGVYCLSWEIPSWIATSLDLLTSNNRKAHVSAMSSLLALCLLTIQSWRRFYETWFVSVFSDSRMNLSHYAVGFIHYFGAVTAVLAESPGFVDDTGKIPQGDWFDLVSSPHNLAEILMYLAITLILWGSSTWPFVFLWVLSNQVETALLTHWWYKSSFKDYPASRKAVIPYVL
ncbi:Polyprenol reductase [Blattella germanica]|nr:Polyprenol reductase [Blattella germanica]